MESFTGDLGIQETYNNIEGWVFPCNEEDNLEIFIVDEEGNILDKCFFESSADVGNAHPQYSSTVTSNCRFHYEDAEMVAPIYVAIYINGVFIDRLGEGNYVTEKYRASIEMNEVEDSLYTDSETAIGIGNVLINLFQGISPYITIVALLSYIGVCVLTFKCNNDVLMQMFLCITGVLLSAFVLMFGVTLFSSWISNQATHFYGAGCYSLMAIWKYLSIAVFVMESKKHIKNMK